MIDLHRRAVEIYAGFGDGQVFDSPEKVSVRIRSIERALTVARFEGMLAAKEIFLDNDYDDACALVDAEVSGTDSQGRKDG
jgi:hypothetical protein